MRPLSFQPPSTLTAFDWTLARSEPDSGSDMPMPKQRSPVVILGRNACFCSSVPKRSSEGAIWRSAIHWAATGAPTASSSSVTAKRSRNVRP